MSTEHKGQFWGSSGDAAFHQFFLTFKQNWLQFLLLTKAAALKQQIPAAHNSKPAATA